MQDLELQLQEPRAVASRFGAAAATSVALKEAAVSGTGGWIEAVAEMS